MFALLFFFRKVLQSIPSCDIVFCGEAGYVEVTDTVSPVTLILTPEILFVINHEDDEQQQAFAVAELECGVKTGDTTLLTIIWRDTFSSHDDRVGIILKLTSYSQLTLIFEPVHEISNNVVCLTSKASDQPAHTCSLIGAFVSRLSYDC